MTGLSEEFRHCPDCGGFIDPLGDGSWPDECPHCGFDGNHGTAEQYLFSKVYGRLDGTGGMLDSLANALHAAGEAGHPIESHDDRRADIDNGLQRAFEEMDSEDPDAEEVLDWIDHAESAAREFHGGLSSALRDYEVPDHVDTGVYDTLGGYAEYVRKDLIALRDWAERWAERAE